MNQRIIVSTEARGSIRLSDAGRDQRRPGYHARGNGAAASIGAFLPFPRMRGWPRLSPAAFVAGIGEIGTPSTDTGKVGERYAQLARLRQDRSSLRPCQCAEGQNVRIRANHG